MKYCYEDDDTPAPAHSSEGEGTVIDAEPTESSDCGGEEEDDDMDAEDGIMDEEDDTMDEEDDTLDEEDEEDEVAILDHDECPCGAESHSTEYVACPCIVRLRILEREYSVEEIVDLARSPPLRRGLGCGSVPGEPCWCWACEQFWAKWTVNMLKEKLRSPSAAAASGLLPQGNPRKRNRKGQFVSALKPWERMLIRYRDLVKKEAQAKARLKQAAEMEARRRRELARTLQEVGRREKRGSVAKVERSVSGAAVKQDGRPERSAPLKAVDDKGHHRRRVSVQDPEVAEEFASMADGRQRD